MSAPPDVAGVSLAVPRLRYEIEGRPWGSATLTREHAARALDGATLSLRLAEGEAVATFDLRPFAQPAVQPYYPPVPAVAWRGLVVEQGLLARPELVWSGAFPAGWDEGLAPDQATALREALAELHRRYKSLVEPRSADYTLRQVECAECHAARLASVPARPPHLRFLATLPPPPRCSHGPAAMVALGELCAAHPELTFELLGWLEPAGARLAAEGPEPSRFALPGPLLEALAGPWLVDDEAGTRERARYRGYDPSRYTYQPAWTPEPKGSALTREQRAAVGLAAAAWGYGGSAEALVVGDAAGGAVGALEAGALGVEVEIVVPGVGVRRRRRRGGRKRG